MMTEFEDLEPRYWQYPAQVLGCLQPGEVTVILGAGLGLADGGQPIPLPVKMVPEDLRMPNCEFDVQFDRLTHTFTRVLRKN